MPNPVRLDRSKLHIWPDASGMQHSEVEALRDQHRWVTLAPWSYPDANLSATQFFNRIDHFAHGVPAARSEIQCTVRPTAQKMLEGQHMSISKVAHVDVITNRGAIRSVIVISTNFYLGQNA